MGMVLRFTALANLIAGYPTRSVADSRPEIRPHKASDLRFYGAPKGIRIPVALGREVAQ